MGYEGQFISAPKPPPRPPKERKQLKRTAIKRRRKVTGEAKLFLEIYEASDKRCQISGEPLLPPEHDMFHFQFAHVLSKGAFPRYRLERKNIIRMLPKYHDYLDNKTDQVRNDERWAWVFELRESLKEQYNKGI